MSTLHHLAHRADGRESVLLLHASGGSPRHWAPIAAALAPRLQVRTPPLIGYGGDPCWEAAGPLSLDDEADRVAPLLQARPAHLFGHSYGGAVALQVALRWPDRVLSLTLFEPVRFALLRGDAATAAAAERIVGVGRRIGREVLAGRLHPAAERFVDYWSGSGTWQTLAPAQRDTLASRMPKVRAEFEALFADQVPAAAYRTLCMPVHLLGGTLSPMPARQVVTLLAAQLPRAGGVTLTGVGHMAPVTDPALVVAHLPPWLDAPALREAA